MSPLLPRIKAKDLIRVVKQLGFELDRQKGSHAVFYRPSDKARVVIPAHAGQDIKLKTLHGIIDDMRITPEKLKELL
ncbi:MAG: type II toxin-antitoxin system HicA family toxin [Gammaproteobacteria bacterium]